MLLLYRAAHEDRSIDIDSGFRRGEGGCVEVVWAFTVTRRGSPGDFGLSMYSERAHHPRATMKAHPAALHRPRPYGRARQILKYPAT